MINIKIRVERCLYLVRILDSGFCWYVRTRVTSSTAGMPSLNFVWKVTVYIWLESWTAAFADTFEPEIAPPRLSCYSPTNHSSLFYFVLYCTLNHNHDMNPIIKLQLIFWCTIRCTFMNIPNGFNNISDIYLNTQIEFHAFQSVFFTTMKHCIRSYVVILYLILVRE